MKKLLTQSILCVLIASSLNVQAMQKASQNDNALVKVVIDNQSGIHIMATTIGQGGDSVIIVNFNKSDAFTLQEYVFTKTKFQCNKLRFSSPKGVYELITWLKRNGSVHVDVNLDNRLVEKLSHIPLGTILTIQVDSEGIARIVKQQWTVHKDN